MPGMGLFGVMDIASSGMNVQARAIRTAGHNIANVDNPEFTRQRQVVSAILPSVTEQGTLGNGVELLSVERITDRFVEAQLLKHGNDLGSADVQAEALSLIESVFNEQGAEGLGAVIDHLYDAFSDLAASPTPGGSAERSAVLGAAQRLVGTIKDLDSRLRDQFVSTNLSIETTVPRINRLVNEINDLNIKIVASEITAPANDLRDARDTRVRDLASLIDVRSSEREGGAIALSLPSGLPLLEGVAVYELSASPAGTTPLGLNEQHVFWSGSGGTVDVSAQIGGGKLGGLLRVRETTLPQAIRSLDTVAYNLGATVNSIHAGGTGLDGRVGDFFALPAQLENAARDLAIDPAILANVDSIAAGITSAPGDNRNALALAELRTTASALFLPGDLPGPATGPSRTLLEHVATITIDVGEQARLQLAERSSQERIVQDLQNRRDEVSGVSLDEEMARLIQVQAAFQANARIVSIVDELVEDVLSII